MQQVNEAGGLAKAVDKANQSAQDLSVAIAKQEAARQKYIREAERQIQTMISILAKQKKPIRFGRILVLYKELDEVEPAFFGIEKYFAGHPFVAMKRFNNKKYYSIGEEYVEQE